MEQLLADRFERERPLGRGGMSEVWLARDLALDRPVAIKILDQSAPGTRFKREARFAASLEHSNIVGVFDYGEAAGRPYLVLEYLPGGTLEELLTQAEGPVDYERTAAIARDVAAGLAHAHGRGIIHRDLKPSNVLFDAAGRAKIGDFGVARSVADGAGITATGTVLGTALYMSPEQAAGEQTGPQSDVYAFGLMLYRLLTGRLPYEADSPVAAALKRLSEPVPAVEDIRADAPPALAALAMSALAIDPADRPADGLILLQALDDPSGLPADTLELEPVPAARASRRRRNLVLALTAGLVALGGFGASVLLTAEAEAPATPRPAETFRAARTAKERADTAPETAPTAETEAPSTARETTTDEQQEQPEPTTTSVPTTTSTPTTTTTPTTTSTPTTTAPATTETAPATTTTE